MRQIKFRGWWRHRDGSAHELIEDISERPISDLNESHFIIEQSTGLQDKNGKDIYEGDKIIDKSNFVTTIEWSEEHLTFQCFGKHRSYRPFLVDLDLNEWEIIGNIHKNPELLK